MKPPVDRTYPLTIYLLKQDFKEAQYLRTPVAAIQYSVKLSDALNGSLYVPPAKQGHPKWYSLVNPAVEDLPNITTKSASALLIVPIKQATFAISFGYGRKLLAPGSWEEDFGLKVTLNSVDKHRIRSLDR